MTRFFVDDNPSLFADKSLSSTALPKFLNDFSFSLAFFMLLALSPVVYIFFFACRGFWIIDEGLTVLFLDFTLDAKLSSDLSCESVV
jgi:hypothetical protein